MQWLHTLKSTQHYIASSYSRCGIFHSREQSSKKKTYAHMAAFRALVPPCRNYNEHSKNLAICVHACVVIVLATCHGCLDITANVVRPCHTPDHTYEKFRRALKIVTSVHQPFGSRRRRGINKRSRGSTHL